MENYIVRIYRRSNNTTENILGVVDGPDTAENKTFRNFEELYNIFFPPGVSSGVNKRKQIVELRKFRRFKINEGTLIFNGSTDVGKITDISLGGLAFSSSHVPEKSDQPYEVGIICAENKCCADSLHCKNIIAHEVLQETVLNEYPKNKRFSIEFGELSPVQHQQLNYIIQHCTLDEG